MQKLIKNLKLNLRDKIDHTILISTTWAHLQLHINTYLVACKLNIIFLPYFANKTAAHFLYCPSTRDASILELFRRPLRMWRNVTQIRTGQIKEVNACALGRV